MLAKDRIKLVRKLNALTDTELLVIYKRHAKQAKQNEIDTEEQEKLPEVIKYRKLLTMKREGVKVRKFIEDEFIKRGGYKTVYNRVKKERESNGTEK